MYLTSGANVSTRRSRTARSSVLRYSFHSASVSSEERRRLEVLAVASFTTVLLGAGGTLDVSGRPRTFRIPNIRRRTVDMRPPGASPLLGMGWLEPPATRFKGAQSRRRRSAARPRARAGTGPDRRAQPSVQAADDQGRRSPPPPPPVRGPADQVRGTLPPPSPSQELFVPMALRLVQPVDGPAASQITPPPP